MSTPDERDRALAHIMLAAGKQIKDEPVQWALDILRSCIPIERAEYERLRRATEDERAACCAEIRKILSTYGHASLANKLAHRIEMGLHVGATVAREMKEREGA